MSKQYPRFHHGYNHCTSETCELRADCASHLAYLEALELGLKNFKTMEECDNKELDYCRVRIEPPDVNES